MRCCRGSLREMLIKVEVGCLEELHPRCVAGEIVNLVRQDQFIVLDVMGPERLDELGRLPGRHIAIVVRLDDEHWCMPLIDGGDRRRLHCALHYGGVR